MLSSVLKCTVPCFLLCAGKWGPAMLPYPTRAILLTYPGKSFDPWRSERCWLGIVRLQMKSSQQTKTLVLFSLLPTLHIYDTKIETLLQYLTMNVVRIMASCMPPKELPLKEELLSYTWNVHLYPFGFLFIIFFCFLFHAFRIEGSYVYLNCRVFTVTRPVPVLKCI